MILNVLSYQGGVEAGFAYRRLGTGSVVEVARVLNVASDRMGIPHVRYQLYVARGSSLPTTEYRTLSLEAFQNRYRELVEEKE
jgi:hypothetical protein